MDRTLTDSSAHYDLAISELIESYLFDGPDFPTVGAWASEVWPAVALHDVTLRWGQEKGSFLHRAAADGRLVWVNALIARGANPWQPCPAGLPAMGWAARSGQTATFLRALDAPGFCPPPSPTAKGTTVFHAVMANPDPVVVEAWLGWWAVNGDPMLVSLFDRPDENGVHPSHLAADREDRSEETLQRLMELGFSPDALDLFGRTPQARQVRQHPRAPVVPAAVPLRALSASRMRQAARARSPR